MNEVLKDRLWDKGEVAEYTVYYPTGKIFSVIGTFSLVASADPNIGTGPAIKTRDNEVVMLDPRGIVTTAKGIIYNPRDNTMISSPMRKWLSEHPEWPLQVV